MVAVLVIPDGAAQPLRGGVPTALQAARTPVLDALAATGEVARVAVTPAGVPAGSEAGVPALLGHPPIRALGRGRIDAAGYGVPVPRGLVPWRADVWREDDTRASAGMARLVAAALGGAWTHGHRMVLFAPEGSAPAGGRRRARLAGRRHASPARSTTARSWSRRPARPRAARGCSARRS